MIRGQAYIDDVDIADYGLAINTESYANLLSFPALKTPYSNDWKDEDGLEVDLSNPTLQDKTVEIIFTQFVDGNELFFEKLKQTGYRSIFIPAFNRSWILRFVGENERKSYQNGKVFTLKFIDDFPRVAFVGVRKFLTIEDGRFLTEENKRLLELFDFQTISSGRKYIPKQDFYIDNICLRDIGIGVIKSKDSILMNANLKEQLTRVFEREDGKTYDTGIVKSASKDASIELLMIAETTVDLWKNYAYFFNKIISPEGRIIKKESEFAGSFFYKNASDFKFGKDNQYAYLKFTLNITMTDMELIAVRKFLTIKDGRFLTEENNRFLEL